MSTVNYAEALILIEDRQPQLASEIRDAIALSSIRLIPPTVEHAETAAAARLRYPLNLGDCFAYALAKSADCPGTYARSRFLENGCSCDCSSTPMSFLRGRNRPTSPNWLAVKADATISILILDVALARASPGA